MSLLQYRIALQSLRMNRARTALTTLGIIIGVASITLVLSLGGGAQNTVSQQVSKLDNNVILIKTGGDQLEAPSVQQLNPYALSTTSSLTELDLGTVRLTKGVTKIAPVMVLGGSVRTADGVTGSAPIIATSPDLAHILQLKQSVGQFIDSSTARDTVVVGRSLAVELYGTDQVLGQQLLLKGVPHTIIGVVKETNAPINLSGIDLDRTVYVSLDDGKSFNQGVAQIQQMLVTAENAEAASTLRDTLDTAILKNHDNEHDFSVLAGQTIAERNNGLFTLILIITGIVACITLMVGGIGIMNIMLVGVSERTREIGIRKALGATNRHILDQFLIEALIMCVVGGILGLATAYGLAWAIATPLSFQPAMSWYITATGLGMAFVTGILFGLYPAIKAARQNPIESLRQYH